MELAQIAFLTTVIFAVFLMALVVVAMILRKEPAPKVDAELERRLAELQQRQIMEGLERRAMEMSLQQKILSLGLALKEAAQLTDIKSDDKLAEVLIDIGTPGPPLPEGQG